MPGLNDQYRFHLICHHHIAKSFPDDRNLIWKVCFFDLRQVIILGIDKVDIIHCSYIKVVINPVDDFR